MKLKSIKKNALAVTLALGMVIPNALPAWAQEAFTANSWINIDPNSGINSDLSNSLYMNSTDSIYYGASKEDILRHYPSGDFRNLKDKVSKAHTFGYYLKMKEGSRRRDFTGLVDKTSNVTVIENWKADGRPLGRSMDTGLTRYDGYLLSKDGKDFIRFTGSDYLFKSGTPTIEEVGDDIVIHTPDTSYGRLQINKIDNFGFEESDVLGRATEERLPYKETILANEPATAFFDDVINRIAPTYTAGSLDDYRDAKFFYRVDIPNAKQLGITVSDTGVLNFSKTEDFSFDIVYYVARGRYSVRGNTLIPGSEGITKYVLTVDVKQSPLNLSTDTLNYSVDFESHINPNRILDMRYPTFGNRVLETNRISSYDSKNPLLLNYDKDAFVKKFKEVNSDKYDSLIGSMNLRASDLSLDEGDGLYKNRAFATKTKTTSSDGKFDYTNGYESYTSRYDAELMLRYKAGFTDIVTLKPVYEDKYSDIVSELKNAFSDGLTLHLNEYFMEGYGHKDYIPNDYLSYTDHSTLGYDAVFVEKNKRLFAYITEKLDALAATNTLYGNLGVIVIPRTVKYTKGAIDKRLPISGDYMLYFYNKNFADLDVSYSNNMVFTGTASADHDAFFEAFVPLHVDYKTETSVVSVSPEILKNSVMDDDTARAISEVVSESMQGELEDTRTDYNRYNGGTMPSPNEYEHLSLIGRDVLLGAYNNRRLGLLSHDAFVEDNVNNVRNHGKGFEETTTDGADVDYVYNYASGIKGNAKYYLNAPLKFTSKHVSLDEEYEGDGPLTKADRKALEMTAKAAMPMVKKFVFDSLELKPDGGIARVRAYYTKDKYILASIKTTNLEYPANGEDVRPNEEDIKEEIPSNENGSNMKPDTGKSDETSENPVNDKRKAQLSMLEKIVDETPVLNAGEKYSKDSYSYFKNKGMVTGGVLDKDNRYSEIAAISTEAEADMSLYFDGDVSDLSKKSLYVLEGTGLTSEKKDGAVSLQEYVSKKLGDVVVSKISYLHNTVLDEDSGDLVHNHFVIVHYIDKDNVKKQYKIKLQRDDMDTKGFVAEDRNKLIDGDLYNYLTEYLGVAPDYYYVLSDDNMVISKWAGRRVYYSYRDAGGVRHLAGGRLEKFTARDDDGTERCIIDHLSLNMSGLDVDAEGKTGNEYLDDLPVGDERDDLIMNTVVPENMPTVSSDTSVAADTPTVEKPKSKSELREEKVLSGDFTDRELGWTSREYKRTAINGWDYDWQDGWHTTGGYVWDFGTCPNNLWLFRPVYDERTVNYVPELPKEIVTPKEESKVSPSELPKENSKEEKTSPSELPKVEKIEKSTPSNLPKVDKPNDGGETVDKPEDKPSRSEVSKPVEPSKPNEDKPSVPSTPSLSKVEKPSVTDPSKPRPSGNIGSSPKRATESPKVVEKPKESEKVIESKEDKTVKITEEARGNVAGVDRSITVHGNDGTVDSKTVTPDVKQDVKTVNRNVKTSDSSASLVYAMISMISGFSLMVFLANRKKKEE